MLLDRIEIDRHGPLTRVEIGPLSHHLNVIWGPLGSGKTAISRFIRDSLVERDYPTGMLSGSAGRVVWVDANGWINIRREHDGTPTGRRRVEFQPRSDVHGSVDGYPHGWFDGGSHDERSHGFSHTASRDSFAARSLASVQIPESIVDGVMVDTLVTSVSHVVAACLQAGLGVDGLAPLPLQTETARYGAAFGEASACGGGDDANVDVGQQRLRRTWRAELADVEAQLARWDAARANAYAGDDLERADRWAEESEGRRRTLLSQRREVLQRRETLLRRGPRVDSLDGRYDGFVDERQTVARLRSLHQRADSLRAQAVQCQHWIDELNHQAGAWHDRGPVGIDADSGWFEFDRPFDSQTLARIDAEIIGLRRAISEIRGVRDRLEHRRESIPGDLLGDGIRRRRYDHFVSALDHYRADRPWDDFYRTAYRPLHDLDEVALRMEAALHQIDALLASIDHVGPERSGRWRLVQSLRQVRSELGTAPSTIAPIHVVTQLDLRLDELTATLDQMLVARADLVERSTIRRSAAQPESFRSDWTMSIDWMAQRDASRDRLRAIEIELRSVLDETARLRRRMRYLPIADPEYPIGMADHRSVWQTEHVVQPEFRWSAAERRLLADYDAQLRHLDDELRYLEVRLRRRVAPVVTSPASDIGWLELTRRRDELIARLRRHRPITRRESNLRELACGWLVRLSGGRLRQIRWSAITESSPHLSAGQGLVEVLIDEQPERTVSATTRALAAMAVRMAAGELLARLGRGVPLVIETHRELCFATPTSRSFDPYGQWTSEGIAGDSIASALADYAAASRQILLLTSDVSLADAIARSGGRLFRLATQRLVHPHRPLWRDGRARDRYVGPHALDAVSGLPDDSLAIGDSLAPLNGGTTTDRINREFERAWIETAGLNSDVFDDRFDRPVTEPAVDHAPLLTATRHPATSTDLPPVGTEYRDGYYYANQTTTPQPRRASQADPTSIVLAPSGSGPRLADNGVAAAWTVNRAAESPYFLTVDSPIDAAPSIDAIAATRLRRIGISHITHLMNQDSNRLADTLGLAGVDARTIRRWQSECRLMCRVPQLRGFDARVLVGCGINDPAQLAAIHPTDLLDRVKTFLATEQGQRILLSGTSYELSRITSWIASANQSVQVGRRRDTLDGHRTDRVLPPSETDVPVALYRTADDDFDQQRYEVMPRTGRETARTTRRGNRERNGRVADGEHGRRTIRTSEPGVNRATSTRTAAQRTERMPGPRSADRPDRERRPERAERSIRAERSDRATPRVSRGERDQSSSLRFYLQRSSDVVDAPSIGPRMAERLNRLGIHTVDDLLRTDAASIASQLNHRRITAEVIEQWQQQSTLVCRVPMMRGHDAQFLVAAGVTTAEQLAASSPGSLYPKVQAIGHSSEGKRIARGGSLPDLAEVTGWIEYASQHRPLKAA